MAERKRKTKSPRKATDLAAKLNEVGDRPLDYSQKKGKAQVELQESSSKKTKIAMSEKPSEVKESGNVNDPTFDAIFENWEEADFEPDAYMIEVPVGSLESAVGYSSLFRQMHQAFVRRVAFHKTPEGGSLSTEDARARAFHSCTNKEEAKKEFRTLMGLPLESLNFVDLLELHSFAPRVAERFWERTKLEGRKEFISGHLSANITFPEGYMKQVWNMARYLGVRESFIDDWKPTGGIEYSLIDMLTQTYFQWQFWLEQTVKRSQTREREQHPEYSRWMAQREKEYSAQGWTDGYWFRPFVSEQQALEHAVQMADRWNRMYMRTLRQLRDLRRYTPVTINNPNQVNIAAEGGQQVNVTE